MPIEIIALRRPSVFTESSMAGKTNALLGNRLEIPDSISTILGEGEHDVTPNSLRDTFKVDVIVFDRGNAVVRVRPTIIDFTENETRGRIQRLPEDSSAVVLCDEIDLGMVLVHGFILHRR